VAGKRKNPPFSNLRDMDIFRFSSLNHRPLDEINTNPSISFFGEAPRRVYRGLFSYILGGLLAYYIKACIFSQLYIFKNHSFVRELIFPQN